MCRVLSYLGKPITLEDLLYEPDNSFIKQSYRPKYMSNLLNLAGFGLAAWETESHDPERPFVYKTPQLPFYDQNLRSMASKISPHCFLAHLRGVAYADDQIVSALNVHPFIFSGSNVALAHNGSLHDFNKMKFDLLEYILPEYQSEIHGTTDSEWIYAVFLSQLSKHAYIETDEIIRAIITTFKILIMVRRKHNIVVNSPVNLFISNGDFIAATRYVLDYGKTPQDGETSPHFMYHSLWYTYGESYGYFDDEYKMKLGKDKTSLIIASEPLTEVTTTWIEVPEYSLLVARRENGEIKLTSEAIHL